MTTQVGERAMRYLILVEKSATGYSAYIPDLPGCVATGSTKEETKRNIRDAFRFHLDGMKVDGEVPEPPHTFAIYEDVSG